MPGGRAAEVIVDQPRTTLSFLVTTCAVAVTIVFGLSHATAAASPAEVAPAVATAASAPDPPHVAPDTSADPAVMIASLRRMARLPDSGRDSTDSFGPASEIGPPDPPPAVVTTSVPSPAAPEPPSTTATSPAAPELFPTATATTATTTRHDSSTEPLPIPMAVRRHQAISAADFRRFVDTRPFTTIDHVTPSLVHGTITENDQHINVVLVHRSATAPMRVSPGDRRREPVGAWAEAIGATAGINANWYGPFDGPAVSGGRVYGGPDHGYTALFGFTAEGDLVADHHHKVHAQVDPRVREAVAGHPTLIHRGTATGDFGGDPTFTERHPRTAIGVSSSVDVLILVTVDGRRRDAVGMTGAETTQLLQQLGAHDAVMLDGGGSSAMWIAGRGIVNRPADPGRAVGNQIAVHGR